MTSNSTKFISMKKFGRNTMATAVSLAVLSPAAVMAQGLMLEEVLVTAQKREERAMDVPIAIGTFTPQNLADTGALSIQDIDAFIPGFDSGSTSFTQNSVSIRGLSTSNISTGGDPSVATFYDDAYVPSAAATVQFSDVASIEVLKGPQGTLFGRNASAGVVNIQPNKPSADADGFVSTRIGNYGLQRFEGMINVPITDNVFLRANLLNNERDGYQENTIVGGRDPEEQSVTAGRLSVLWEASEDTTAQFSFDFDDIDNGAQQAIGVVENSAYTGKDPFDQKVQHDAQAEGETRQNYSYNAKLFHDISDVLTMKVVANYREWETYNLQDEDGTGLVATNLTTNNIEDSDIFYSELQLNYTGEDITAVFGANYSSEDVFQNTLVSTISLGDTLTERVENTGDFTNYGAYGDVTYDLGDRWTFSAGLRYSHDDKDFTWLIPDTTNPILGSNIIFTPVTDPKEEASDSWSKVTGRALAKYQISENAMTYLSYSTGYKSGGFDSLEVATATDPLEPEETTSYELGIKGDFFDNSLRTQFSLFRLDVEDKAVSKSSLQPGAQSAIPTLISGDATIDGVEITVDWLVADELKLGLVTTFRENEETLESFYDATGITIPSETVDSNTNTEYTVTLDWAPEVEFGGILLHVDYQFKEDTSTNAVDFNPLFLSIPGIGEDLETLNARLAWTNNQDNLTISVWGQNILDNEKVKGTGTLSLAFFGTAFASVEPPRTYGVDVRYTF
ncbi:MAG: iron complex outermembrane receptor protein [Pseudomonadales bacterium]|jgi:iron complex outermembrane receptor protein